MVGQRVLVHGPGGGADEDPDGAARGPGLVLDNGRSTDRAAFITPDPAQWLAGRLNDLDAGNIEAIISAARQYPLEGVKAEDLDRKLGYFEHNIHRMRYARFKKLGMFTGSGAIEAACKQIVCQRAKQSGMHWTVEGAADIIALCCQHASGRWDELWPQHTPALAGLRAVV